MNKVILVGNVGQDAESVTETVTKMTIATSEKRKNKEGELIEETEWHRVVVFGNIAARMAEWCKKGTKVCVEGKIKTRKWTDNNNVERYTTEIVVDMFGKIEILSSKQESDGNREYNQQAKPKNNSNSEKPQNQSKPSNNKPAPAPTPAPAQDEYDYGSGNDDDIPF